ncbi:MAG: YabP/YqfC family sporulation protein [Anaeroplasma sp.]
MDNANFIVYNNKIVVNNITLLKEFNSNYFNIEINKELYLIKGKNLELKEVLNNNTTINIEGTIYLIEKVGLKKEKDKNFIKRLLS